MNKKEFRQKKEALVAEMTNLEGAQFEAKQRELNALIADYQFENAEMQREALPRKKSSIVGMLREAMQNNKRSITVQGYTAEGSVKVDGVHDDIIETETQGILEPLYAKSALAALGVRFFPGLPQGDIRVPVMGKGTVGWAGEIAKASASNNEFSSVTLQPKRLTAYVDISKQLIVQDTVGAEEAIRRDLVNAINDKLEATIFGNAAGDSTKPCGMFWNDQLEVPAARTLTDATTYKNLVNLEATLEEANVYSNIKYLLSPGSKADLRAMAKNGNGSQTVFANGDVDGVGAVVTSNVAAGKFIYGDFSCLAVGSWGNVDITICDDSQTAIDGVVRLVVNAYFDAKILRQAAFVYGKTRTTV